jgi:hypothetical protein
MKTVGMFFFALILATAARAGEIYGTVSEGGKPVAAGLSLRLACGTVSADARTDAYGAYSLKSAATGKCALSAPSVAGAPALAVTVYEKSARYDLVIARAPGKSTLTRR